jgi:hypothetical protein
MLSENNGGCFYSPPECSKSGSRLSSIPGFKLFLFIFLLALKVTPGIAQLKDCRDCYVPSFQAFTAYYILQPGSDFGFGFEAGKWNKDASRFSYFLGSKLQWFQLNPNSDKFKDDAKNIRFTVYMKGQARVVDRLYFELTPQFVDLNFFDIGLGMRYTYPLSESVGIGIEPTYLVVQKEYSMNANIHFAL